MLLNKTKKLKLFIFIFIFLLIFCLQSCSKSEAMEVNQTSEQEVVIIDGHNHIMGRTKDSSGHIVYDFEGATENAVKSMEKFKIKKMLITPPPFSEVNQKASEDIEDYIKVLAKYPDKFVLLGGGGTLNVMIHSTKPDEVTEELKQKFKKRAMEIIDMGAIGFGEMSAEHFCLGKNHHYSSAPPDHPLFLFLADISAEYNMPIDIHMEAIVEEISCPEWLETPPNPAIFQPNIAAFERLLSHNRDAKIIWDHICWDNTGYRTPELTKELLNKHPNLYMSIKICNDVPEQFYPLDNSGNADQDWINLITEFPDRFFIGSDHFYCSPLIEKKPPPSVEQTMTFLSQIPVEIIEQIAYKNFEKIFKKY